MVRGQCYRGITPQKRGGLQSGACGRSIGWLWILSPYCPKAEAWVTERNCFIMSKRRTEIFSGQPWTGNGPDDFLQADLSAPILSYDRAETGNSKINT